MQGRVVGAAVAVALLGLGAAGCTPETECDYLPAIEPTNVIAEDIQGCWHGIGRADLGQDPAFLVVYDFNAFVPGQVSPVREIQSANRIFPNGQVFLYSYALGELNGRNILDMGWSSPETPLPVAEVEVTDTTLRLEWLFGLADRRPQPMRRAQCSGFGFEETNPAEACARSAALAQRRPIPFSD